MRKLTYYIACSSDGFICREDGSINDFTMDGEHFADLLNEFPETIPGHLREPLNVKGDAKHFDTVLMGRRTYEVGLAFDITNPYPHLKQYVFSQTMDVSPDPDINVVATNALQSVRELKAVKGKGIWLCGGASLASVLASEIDELILKINPFLMGKGVSLFANSLPRTALQLRSRKTYDNGFMLLNYAVDQPAE